MKSHKTTLQTTQKTTTPLSLKSGSGRAQEVRVAKRVFGVSETNRCGVKCFLPFENQSLFKSSLLKLVASILTIKSTYPFVRKSKITYEDLLRVCGGRTSQNFPWHTAQITTKELGLKELFVRGNFIRVRGEKLVSAKITF